MVLMRFTRLLDKLRSRYKKQTIRKPRKNPIKVGNTLQIYTLELLGEAKVTKIVSKRLIDITLEDAIRDGFSNRIDCIMEIMKMHNCLEDEEFDIISYEPEWEACALKPLTDLDKLNIAFGNEDSFKSIMKAGFNNASKKAVLTPKLCPLCNQELILPEKLTVGETFDCTYCNGEVLVEVM